MNDLIIIKDVRGYVDDDDMAWLHIEDVARGLGITTVAKSGNETVRWTRIDEYLRDLGYAMSSKTTFIPENIFYRLCMKANNSVARKFQELVADEILPAIRKSGKYAAKQMTAAELIQAQANLLVEHERQINALKSDIKQIKAVFTNDDDRPWQENMSSSIRKMCHEYNLPYENEFREMYAILESAAHVDLKTRQSNMQRRMREEGARYEDIRRVTKLSIIASDPKLRLIFGNILTRRKLMHMPLQSESAVVSQ